MKILFLLINMNLGGTEKALLNLLVNLPEDSIIDILLLEKKGALMAEIPVCVNVILIDNHHIINEYIQLGSRRFGLKQLKKRKFGLFLKSEIQFFLDKLKLSKNPFWAIQSYIKPLAKEYDISIAYAGIHNFLTYYILKKTTARKKILWIHFDIEKIISDFNFGKLMYPNFNQIFCVAENASAIFKEKFPAARQKVFTFNNIINRNNLLQQAESGVSFNDDFTGIRILTLGRLSEEKGQLMIPQIVKKLKDEHFKFRWYLIGEGKLTVGLTQEVKRLGIEKELILLGRKMNPYRYLRDCDLYVQTSFYEGDPIVLREAKVFKRPIVTTNFLSASNLISHQEDGLIVDISVHGLFAGVKTLLANKDLRDKFSSAIDPEIDYEENIANLLSLKEL